MVLNGQRREVPDTASVREFLAVLNVNPQQVAVAVNGEVVPRSSWDGTRVKNGDAVEIVRAVGGG